MLYAGIVGLPNVGKTTLFNALIKNETKAENYMFATTEAQKGVVEVDDYRLEKVRAIIGSKEVVPTTIEFIDIPGLVFGSSHGEGLGNQFLASIREVDTICHIVRCFVDDDILHINNKIDAVNDAMTVELELNYADYDVITRKLERLHKKMTVGGSAAERLEYNTLIKLEKALAEDIPIRKVQLSDDEVKAIRSYNFLSQKPLIYIANIGENDITDPLQNNEYKKLLKYATEENIKVVPVCAKFEHDSLFFDAEEKEFYYEELKLSESGLITFINMTYDSLGLKTFITTGPQQTRAWTFKEGMTAKECAGLIHSDFERGFIRAETVAYTDFMLYGSYQKSKEAGKVRLEGKDYKVKDGDILLFRFNV